MIKRVKENLKSKKGFTLVELIVVIVIILILAAVIVPNVMRYIGQSRESVFQSDASAYLTEIQGYAAESYAKYGKDITAVAGANQITAGDGTTPYTLTAFTDKNGAEGTVEVTDTDIILMENSTEPPYKEIRAQVVEGEVRKFSYQDTAHYVSWSVTDGWSDVKAS